MVKVPIEVHSKTAGFAAVVRAHSIKRAMSTAAVRYPGSVTRVKFPIEPEGFFGEGFAACVGLLEWDRLSRLRSSGNQRFIRSARTRAIQRGSH